MKYYPALTTKEEMGPVIITAPKTALCSYHYFGKYAEWIKNLIAEGVDIFIDSGAFSAETQNYEIDIDKYCKFLIESNAATYAGLDVIGDAKRTWDNTKYMEKNYNLSPIPTFHLGGNLDDLYKLFDYNYIALGGLVFSGSISRYCDEVWSILLKEVPNIRVHGFGMTNFELMERYPWYSVDSSSYKSGRRFGRIQTLWNGFNWKTFSEEEFLKHLNDIGHTTDWMEKKNRRLIYDFYSCNSYKLFASHLDELNKIKDFSYLTAQLKMF